MSTLQGPSHHPPFDNDPVKYLHGGIHHEREKFPVKFGAFVLLDKLKCMDPLNPIRVRLMKEKSKAGFDEAQFKAGVEDASKQLLRFIPTSAKRTLSWECLMCASQITARSKSIRSPWQYQASGVVTSRVCTNELSRKLLLRSMTKCPRWLLGASKWSPTPMPQQLRITFCKP